jgi:hypothetical protein
MLPVLLAAILLAEPAQQLISFNSVFPYTEDAPATPAVGPENVVILEKGVRETVTAMLRVSPTFRRQCARIGRTSHLRVVVTRALIPGGLPAVGARTRISRARDGRVVAEVELGHSGDYVTLLAHEFEHILEQLDEVDLAAMAARAGTGVRPLPVAQGFETERAIAVGRRVADEVRRRGRRREF